MEKPLPLFSKPLFVFTAFLNYRSPLFKKTNKEILIELNQLVSKYRRFSRIFAPKRLRVFDRMFPLPEKSLSTVPVSGLTESALKTKFCMLSR